MPIGWVHCPPSSVPCRSNNSPCQVKVARQLLHDASAPWLTLYCELSPGSHDSFTYWVDVNAPVGPDQKSYVKYLATMFSVVAKKVMVKWSMTQVVILHFSADSPSEHF